MRDRLGNSVLNTYARYGYMGIQILDMDLKTVIVGLAIGVLIGTGGMYAVNLSKTSQLNKQIDALDTQVEQLNDVISNQQTLIDSQNEAIQGVDDMQDEIQAKDTLIAEYEEFEQTSEKLIDMLVEKYNIVNYMCARQTYRAEKALHLLQDYLPEYEPEYEPIVDLRLTFGDFTFTEWWELYGGLFEEWYGLIYP